MKREEAIKILEETSIGAIMFGDKNMVAVCDFAISALREQENRRWIPVTERLPDPWEEVLVYSRYDFCETAMYLGIPGKWRVTWNHQMLEVDSITHWMPLPESPKEDDNAKMQ